MRGDTYNVDGENGTETRECETCGEGYEEAAGLKSGAAECPGCSGGDLS